MRIKYFYILLFFIIFFCISVSNYFNFNINYYDFGINLKIISQSETFYDYKLRPILYFFKVFNNLENIYILPLLLLFLNVLGILLPMLFFIQNKKYELLFFFYPLIFLVGVLVHSGFHTDVYYIYFGILNLLYFQQKNKKLFYVTLLIILLIKSTLLILHLVLLLAYIFRSKILSFKKAYIALILFLFVYLLYKSINNPDLIIYFASHYILLFFPLYLLIYKLNTEEFLFTYILITLLIAHFLSYQILNINNHFSVVSFTFVVFYILKSNKNIFEQKNIKLKLTLFLFLISTTFVLSDNVFNIKNGNLKQIFINPKNINYQFEFLKKLKYYDDHYVVYQNNAFFYLNSNKNNFKYSSLRSDFKKTTMGKEKILLFLNKEKLFIGDQLCDLKLDKCFISKNKIFTKKPSELLSYINKNYISIYENSKIKVLEKIKK